MLRSICLKIVMASAVVVCVGIATSACVWGVRGGHHDDRDDRREEHHEGRR
jgi:hypothetical protein